MQTLAILLMFVLAMHIDKKCPKLLKRPQGDRSVIQKSSRSAIGIAFSSNHQLL